MTAILLVEDDRMITSTLKDFLSKQGFHVTAVSGQRDAMDKLSNNRFDLLLVDISLKDGNGYAICAKAKAEYGLPVIFLTASADESSVVAGFDIGGDDYIIKPFRPRELIARINNVLRRSQHVNEEIRIGPLTIDVAAGKVLKDEREVPLSALEYRILLLFVENRGRVISRDQLLEQVWDIAGNFVNDNTLSVYIKRLREKIEDDPRDPKIIKTIRGLGYRMDDEDVEK